MRLGEAYRGLLMTGRFPICFLRLELPADQVDVNVHPTKMEVRFLDGGKLYSQLLQTLRHQFLTTDLTARARHVPGPLPMGLRDNAITAAGARPGGAAGGGGPLPARADDQRWEAHGQRSGRATVGGGLDLRGDVPSFRPFPGLQSFGVGLPSSGTALDDLPPPPATNASDGQGEVTQPLPPGAQPWSPPREDSVDAAANDSAAVGRGLALQR